MIKPLTGLRFFAALLVLFHHYWGFRAGYFGVSFFYVLSGFVLAISDRERTSTAAGRRDFWWRRFARVYPLHFVTMLAAIPLGFSIYILPFNATLMQSWVPISSVYFSLDWPSWSISNEAFFYAVFPALIVLLRARPWLVLSIWGALLVASAAIFSLLAPGRELSDPVVHFVFYIFPPARLFEFALGMGLGLSPRPRDCGTASEVGVLLLAAGSIAAVYLNPPGAFAAALIFVPASVLLVRTFSVSKGPAASVLSDSRLQLLGKASFALYLVHQLVFRYYPNPWIDLGLALLLSLGLHFWIEVPTRKWLLRVGQRRWPPRAPAMTVELQEV